MAIELPPTLELVVQIALGVTAVLTLMAAYRVVQGPTVPDRMVGLDTIATNVIAIAVLFALLTGQELFVTVGLVLAIIGFISTIAVSRFVIDGDIIE